MPKRPVAASSRQASAPSSSMASGSRSTSGVNAVDAEDLGAGCTVAASRAWCNTYIALASADPRGDAEHAVVDDRQQATGEQSQHQGEDGHRDQGDQLQGAGGLEP